MIHRTTRWVWIASVILLMVLAGMGCGGGQASLDTTPCNPNATAEARAVLTYLGDLTTDKTAGIISGQNCGHGNEITLGNYNTYFESLHTLSGQYPGMLGIDYEFQRIFTLDELKAANVYLKDHWNHGGWITINWSPDNPWGPTKDWQDIRTKYEGTDLDKLITPGSEVYNQWIARLDVIAAALQDLQDAGVVVLWRPMQEMNGNWFWWGKVNFSDSHNAYVRVWRHMYDYFTNVKGLNNLIWVFSPASLPQTLSSFPYPGDDWVDVLGPTQYSDTVTIQYYDDYRLFNKPLGIAESGPVESGSLVIDGTFDNRLYASSFKKNYPRVAYWVTWHSWVGVKMAIIDNQNTSALMNDSYLINRGARP